MGRVRAHRRGTACFSGLSPDRPPRGRAGARVEPGRTSIRPGVSGRFGAHAVEFSKTVAPLGVRRGFLRPDACSGLPKRAVECSAPFRTCKPGPAERPEALHPQQSRDSSGCTAPPACGRDGGRAARRRVPQGAGRPGGGVTSGGLSRAAGRGRRPRASHPPRRPPRRGRRGAPVAAHRGARRVSPRPGRARAARAGGCRSRAGPPAATCRVRGGPPRAECSPTGRRLTPAGARGRCRPR